MQSIHEYILFAKADSVEVMALIALLCLCLAAFGLLIGLFVFSGLYKQKKIPMKQIGDLSPGPVRIKGELTTLSPLIMAPFTSTECIFYSVAFLKGRGGRLAFQDTQSTDFIISDGTGEMLFDVKKSFEGLGRNHAGGWVNTKRIPILGGLAANISAEYRAAASNSRWVIEHCLPPVKDVIITGEAVENRDPATRERAKWVLTGFITSKSEKEIFAKVKLIIGISLGIAVVFGAIGLAIILIETSKS
ncbi:MAG: hypothetical protein ACKJR1_07150 [Limisphaerales bacterium]